MVSEINKIIDSDLSINEKMSQLEFLKYRVLKEIHDARKRLIAEKSSVKKI